jgi:hypothetical protein
VIGGEFQKSHAQKNGKWICGELGQADKVAGIQGGKRWAGLTRIGGLPTNACDGQTEHSMQTTEMRCSGWRMNGIDLPNKKKRRGRAQEWSVRGDRSRGLSRWVDGKSRFQK